MIRIEPQLRLTLHDDIDIYDPCALIAALRATGLAVYAVDGAGAAAVLEVNGTARQLVAVLSTLVDREDAATIRTIGEAMETIFASDENKACTPE